MYINNLYCIFDWMETASQWQGSWVYPLLSLVNGRHLESWIRSVKLNWRYTIFFWCIDCVELRWDWCHFTEHLESKVALEATSVQMWKENDTSALMCTMTQGSMFMTWMLSIPLVIFPLFSAFLTDSSYFVVNLSKLLL